MSQKKRWFPITKLHRDDLIGNGYTKEQAESMTDVEMEEIAYAIKEAMLMDVYWEVIRQMDYDYFRN